MGYQQPGFIYDDLTYDAYRDRVREDVDASHGGPAAFFDPDRQDRPTSCESTQTPLPPTPSVSGAHRPVSRLSRVPADASTRSGPPERKTA